MSGESLVSYMHRLTSANNYSTVSAIGEKMNIPLHRMLSNRFSEAEASEIAKMAMKDQDSLSVMTQNFLKSNIDPFYHRFLFYKKGIKFCPACIRDTVHHKLIWDVNPVAICIKHQSFLIDRCPGCNEPVSISALMDGECHECLCELIKGKTVRVEDEIIYRSQKLLNRYLSSFISRREGRMYYGFSDVVEFMYKSFSLLKVLGVERPSNNHDYANLLSKLFLMYARFPTNLYLTLDEFSQKKNADVRKRHKEMFQSLLNNEKFSFIEHAYRDYWVTKASEGELSKSYLNFFDDLRNMFESNYYTKRDLIAKEGFTRDEVDNLINSGFIETKRVKFGGITQFTIKHKELEKARVYKNELSKVLTKKEAAAYLGTSVESVTKSIKIGVFKQTHNPLMKKGILLNIEDLNRVLNKVVYTTSDLTGLLLKEVIIKYRPRGITVAKILTMMMEGELLPKSNLVTPKLPDLYFDEEQLKRYLDKEDAEKDKYNVSEVAERLSVDTRMVKRLVDGGLLTPAKILHNNNGTRYSFARKEVDHFVENYISVKNTAETFSVSRKVICKWVHDGELVNHARGISHKMLLKKNEVSEKLSRYNKGFEKFS